MESEMHQDNDPFQQGGSHLFGSPIELTLKKGEREKQLEILVSSNLFGCWIVEIFISPRFPIL